MGAEWLRGDEEYEALVRALRRKKGFGLFFVQASPAKGADILAGLKEELGGKRIGTVVLDRSSQDLVEPMAAVWAEGPDLVWVAGMEQSLLGYEDVKLLGGQERDLSHYSQLDVPPLLQRLNLGRERFALLFPCPVVMVVPLFVVRYLLRRAGDFFDWKSGFFEFPDENPHGEIRSFLTDAEFEVYTALEPAERTRRILEAEACLESGTLTTEDKASIHREMGRLFLSEKKYQAALFNFDKAIEIKADYYEAWTSRGINLNDLGRYDKAINSFDKAIEINPNCHYSWDNRGDSLSSLGRYEEAILSHEKALKIKPDYHYSWSSRGSSLSKLGRYDEAIASYDKALEIKPDDAYSWDGRGDSLSSLGQHEEAIASYDKALKFKPDYYYSWRSRGSSLRNLGRHEEAVASYDKALEIESDCYYSWDVRGDSLDDLERYEEAIASYDKSLEIKPDYHYSWDGRGDSLNNLGRYEEAIASYDKALEIKPDYHYSWNDRGDSLRNLGRYEEAILSYQKSIETAPESSTAYNSLGHLLYSRGKPQESYENFIRLTEINPKFAGNWNNAGYLFLVEEVYGNTPVLEKPLAIHAHNKSSSSQGKSSSKQTVDYYQKSLLLFNQAISIEPEMALAWGNSSFPLYKTGDFSTALTSCTTSIQLGLNDEVNYSNHGIILLRLQRPAEAQTSFETALTIEPNYPDAHYGLACAYALQNQLTPALEHLKQAIELNPEQYRTLAQTDSDFDSIRDNEQLQALLNQP
jgi:tetratricopeptide (TPR) repeat protein